MSYLDLAKASIGNQALTPDIKNNFPNQEFKEFRNLEGYGDGQLPPLDRPPATETELRRLIDYLTDPVAFGYWFDALMRQADPAEKES
jgi:hypothetical protein